MHAVRASLCVSQIRRERESVWEWVSECEREIKLKCSAELYDVLWSVTILKPLMLNAPEAGWSGTFSSASLWCGSVVGDASSSVVGDASSSVVGDASSSALGKASVHLFFFVQKIIIWHEAQISVAFCINTVISRQLYIDFNACYL